MTGMDTRLAYVKFQAWISKMERYLNIFHMHNLFFPLDSNSYNFTSASSEDSDQPAYPRTLIRVFAGRMNIYEFLAIHRTRSVGSD